MEKIVLYIHGKGGSAEEAAHYRPLFAGARVIGFDYASQTPWEAREEFPEFYDTVCQNAQSVELVADSIGAFFAMQGLWNRKIESAYFISPIVHMEKLIENMMGWANVTEEELRAKKEIPTSFGETLSWEYLCDVRTHPVSWRVPTHILYGEKDNLTSFETVSHFAAQADATLTVMQGGEHWFHTKEQMAFLDGWIRQYSTPGIPERLVALQDKEYRAFQSKLLPTVPPEAVIGVRTPLLRKLAGELAGTARGEDFLQTLPHTYYEENNLHAFLIERIRDYDRALGETERFLPYIDNWATCDSFCPKVFAKHKPELLGPIRRWLDSGRVYTVRYAMGMLMRYYLDGEFRPEYLAWVAEIHSEEYYVNMMRAWFFATALAKQPENTLPWLTGRRLDAWTHNKTIQKAVESDRIPPEMKEKLREMRI